MELLKLENPAVKNLRFDQHEVIITASQNLCKLRISNGIQVVTFVDLVEQEDPKDYTSYINNVINKFQMTTQTSSLGLPAALSPIRPSFSSSPSFRTSKPRTNNQDVASANGATYGRGTCWAEFGMTGPNSNADFQTCKF